MTMQWNKATMAMALPTKSLTYFNEPGSLAIIYTNRKAPIIQTVVPETSWLRTQDHFDYSNSYITTCKGHCNQLQAKDLVQVFREAAPSLLKRFLANKTKRQHGVLKNMVPVVHQTEQEVVFDMGNSYFDCEISLMLSKPRRDGIQKNIIVSTMASFHEPLGRLYFMLLRPLYERLLLKTVKRMTEISEA